MVAIRATTLIDDQQDEEVKDPMTPPALTA